MVFCQVLGVPYIPIAKARGFTAHLVMKDKINVLGTEYRIEIRKISEDNILRDNKYG